MCVTGQAGPRRTSTASCAGRGRTSIGSRTPWPCLRDRARLNALGGGRPIDPAAAAPPAGRRARAVPGLAAGARPGLLAEYERLYPKAHAPRRAQQGSPGWWHGWSPVTEVGRQRPASPPAGEAERQLDLGI